MGTLVWGSPGTPSVPWEVLRPRHSLWRPLSGFQTHFQTRQGHRPPGERAVSAVVIGGYSRQPRQPQESCPEPGPVLAVTRSQRAVLQLSTRSSRRPRTRHPRGSANTGEGRRPQEPHEAEEKAGKRGAPCSRRRRPTAESRGLPALPVKEARCTLLFYLGEQPPPHTGPCDTPRLAESSANRFVSGVGLPH